MFTIIQWEFWKYIKPPDYHNVTLFLFLLEFYSLSLTNFYFKDEKTKMFAMFTNMPWLPDYVNIATVLITCSSHHTYSWFLIHSIQIWNKFLSIWENEFSWNN